MLPSMIGPLPCGGAVTSTGSTLTGLTKGQRLALDRWPRRVSMEALWTRYYLGASRGLPQSGPSWVGNSPAIVTAGLSVGGRITCSRGGGLEVRKHAQARAPFHGAPLTLARSTFAGLERGPEFSKAAVLCGAPTVRCLLFPQLPISLLLRIVPLGGSGHGP